MKDKSLWTLLNTPAYIITKWNNGKALISRALFFFLHQSHPPISLEKNELILKISKPQCYMVLGFPIKINVTYQNKLKCGPLIHISSKFL